MPCYTTTTVKLSEKVKWDLTRMQSAVIPVGLSGILSNDGALRITGRDFSARVQSGILTISGFNQQATEQAKKILYQAYSAQVLRDASKRFGWRITSESKNNSGLLQIQMNR